MRSGRVILVGWLMLAAGACGRPLVTGDIPTGSGGAGPAQAASPPLADGGVAPANDAGARDPGDGGLAIPAMLGRIAFQQVAEFTRGACATQTPAGWCWVEPRPQGNYLRDLSSGRPGELWAVGSAGTVLHGLADADWTVAWTLVDVGLTGDLTAVSASADGAVFIGSASGDVVRGDASTGGWTKLAAPGLARVTGLWAASGDEAWAVGNEPTAYHWTGPGGWTAADVGPDGVAAVVGHDATDVWMASDIGHFVHWDGAAFTSGDIAIQTRSNYPWVAKHDLHFDRMGALDDGTIWAAATSSNSDAASWALTGGTWSSANAYTMAGASLAEHWASGIGGTAILVSPYGPDDTNETRLGEGAVLAGRMNDLWAIAGAASRHGAYGTWAPETSLFQQTEYVHVAPNGDVWVTGVDAGWKAQAARWDGTQWSVFPLGAEDSPPFVASNGADVWLANTSLWHWSGGELQELPYPPWPNSRSTAGWYARQVFAVPGAVWILVTPTQGGTSTLLRTDGKTWRFVPVPVGYQPAFGGTGLRGTSDRDLWLVTGLSVFHYDGQSWSAPVVLPGSGRPLAAGRRRCLGGALPLRRRVLDGDRARRQPRRDLHDVGRRRRRRLGADEHRPPSFRRTDLVGAGAAAERGLLVRALGDQLRRPLDWRIRRHHPRCPTGRRGVALATCELRVVPGRARAVGPTAPTNPLNTTDSP